MVSFLKHVQRHDPSRIKSLSGNSTEAALPDEQIIARAVSKADMY